MLFDLAASHGLIITTPIMVLLSIKGKLYMFRNTSGELTGQLQLVATGRSCRDSSLMDPLQILTFFAERGIFADRPEDRQSVYTDILDLVLSRNALVSDVDCRHYTNIHSVKEWRRLWLSGQHRKFGRFEALLLSLVLQTDIIIAYNGPKGMLPSRVYPSSQLVEAACDFLDISERPQFGDSRLYLYAHGTDTPFQQSQLSNSTTTWLTLLAPVDEPTQSEYIVYGLNGLTTVHRDGEPSL